MAKTDAIELEGIVTEVLPATKFKVKLDVNDVIVTCSLSGKMRMNKIRIILGDRVTVEMSPYDLGNGRITWRHK